VPFGRSSQAIPAGQRFTAAERGITLVTDYETPGAAMDGQDTASVWAAVAQVHATLAVAAGLEPEAEPELEQAGPQALT
jgi:hypothetical protein